MKILVLCDRDTLEHLYVEKDMTNREIGKMFGVSYETVRRRMRELGIPSRSSRHRKGHLSNGWKGGVIFANGRYLVWKPDHPRVMASGYVYRYILVWEEHHGPVPKGFEIHHKDENSGHDDISNLEILTKSEHAKLHQRK